MLNEFKMKSLKDKIAGEEVLPSPVKEIKKVKKSKK